MGGSFKGFLKGLYKGHYKGLGYRGLNTMDDINPALPRIRHKEYTIISIV